MRYRIKPYNQNALGQLLFTEQLVENNGHPLFEGYKELAQLIRTSPDYPQKGPSQGQLAVYLSDYSYGIRPLSSHARKQIIWAINQKYAADNPKLAHDSILTLTLIGEGHRSARGEDAKVILDILRVTPERLESLLETVDPGIATGAIRCFETLMKTPEGAKLAAIIYAKLRMSDEAGIAEIIRLDRANSERPKKDQRNTQQPIL